MSRIQRKKSQLVGDRDRGSIAREIRLEMAKRGLTQIKLSEKSGYDSRTIRNILNGVRVKDSTLFEVCASLQMEPSKFRSSLTFGQRNRPTGRDSSCASIAILPFLNLNDDQNQDHLVDGFVEDIITELSRFSELLVVARNSTFQFKGKAVDVREIARQLGANYVVEGSVRFFKGRVRVTAQLIDAEFGVHQWAERYDRKLTNIFALQDEIAQTIASILVAHVRKAEPIRRLNRPPETWEAYDHYLRGAVLYSSFPAIANVEEIYETRKHLERAISLDPNYARAHAMLASTHMATWVNPLDNDLLNPAALERAHQAAQTAIQLDPNLPQGYGELGHVLVHKRDHDAAVAAFERACSLNPNYIHWRHGATMTFSGYPARAIEIIKAQMMRDPFYPVQALSFLGHAYLVAKQYANAIEPLREAITRAPNFRPGHLFLAAVYARLGRHEEAWSETQHVLRIDPSFTISGTPKLLAPFKRDRDYKHFVDSFRMAGLPQ